MYITRILEQSVEEVLRTFKVLYVGGPRQAGKTTLLRHVAERRGTHYVTLDDLTLRAQARRDPALFLDSFPTPLLIDEIQYAPELFPFIKIRVDAMEQRGQYWLTGSQQFSLMCAIQESLAGRVGILHLLGFSMAEHLRLPYGAEPFLPTRATPPATPQAMEIFTWIWRGAFPALWATEPPRPELFYSAYIQTYIDRDIRSLFGIERIEEFHLFLQLCAARTGQLLNVAELARDAGVSPPTARQWLDILEQTMLVYLLRPYHRNRSKRLIKSPKLYFLDTGLAAHLTRWPSPETLANGLMAGAFVETFVVAEVVKSYLHRGLKPPLWFYRDKDGLEVDLLIEHEQQMHPMEIKKAVNVSDDEMLPIRAVRRRIPSCAEGAVITLGGERRLLDRETWALPVGYVL